ncbi:hypothetical protein JYT28_00095 [Desulfobulbus sp. AH-315-M07]|nr:hypothetical protein [Desulfobulbus sp. AH-315-M07]
MRSLIRIACVAGALLSASIGCHVDHGHGSAHAERLIGESHGHSEVGDGLMLTPNASLSCATEILGVVDAHAKSAHDPAALAALRKRAKALGAEAITDVEYHHGDHEGGGVHLSGMAVRCKDLIRGRSYDLVAVVHAEAPMGHEDEAFRKLKRDAVALGADLIVDITFEHGDGTDHTVALRGKAIRFVSATSAASVSD